ncbi:ankyrin repeat-containing domain protein [Mycena sanguinolenta]|nr:ankyrin repeat-containing domain protein [Mycena sanguinolenta]
MGHRAMVVKLLGLYDEGMAHERHGRGMTALDCAALKGRFEVVELLASIPQPENHMGGCLNRITRRRSNGEDYLDLALIKSVEAGHPYISEFLLLQGARVNFIANEFGAASPLCHAVEVGSLGMVQLLLSSGADPKLTDYSGVPPLFKAPNIEVAQALLDGGADIHAHDGSRNVLAYVRDQDFLRFYLENGANPNHEDEMEQTPLHLACMGNFGKDSAGAVELLLRFGATTVEKADYVSHTPVDIAMRMGKAEVVKLLEPFVKIATWWEGRET